MSSTKIIGCGNPIAGDDGIGVYIINKLKGLSLPEGITLLEGGTDPLNLLQMLRAAPKAILVDAVKGAGKPGEVVLLTPDQLDLHPQEGLSLHQFNLAHVLSLGYNLYPEEMPKEILVVAIEAFDTTPGNLELSAPVKKAVPQAIQIILMNLFFTPKG